MNASAFMHLFARGPHADTKVFGFLEKICHPRSRGQNPLVVTVNRFKITRHALIDLGFEVRDLSGSATVKLVIDFDGNFFHECKVAFENLISQNSRLILCAQREQEECGLLSLTAV
jgi:hypothetical protein